jgi:hypothetical protein
MAAVNCIMFFLPYTPLYLVWRGAIKLDRDGVIEKYPIGHEHEGKAKVEDMQFEFTRQTRNQLFH